MKAKHLKISFIDEFNRPLHNEEFYWTRGYNFSIKRISRLLGVSGSYVAHTLLKQLNHVVYSPKFAYSKTNRYEQTFICKDDLVDWLIRHAKFAVQTEIVDLYYYLAPYKDVAKEAYELYKDKLENNGRGYRVGTIPPEVLKLVNEKLKIYGAETNYPCDRRKEVPWKRVDAFNFLDKEFYSAKDEAHKDCSREKIYRNAFLKGDIKVNISPQITIFVHRNQKVDGMKMPYLVPYGKKIYVDGKK